MIFGYTNITFESIILAILKTCGTNSTGFCSLSDNSGRPTKAHLYLNILVMLNGYF